jgi:hypothetical protein
VDPIEKRETESFDQEEYGEMILSDKEEDDNGGHLNMFEEFNHSCVDFFLLHEREEQSAIFKGLDV